MGRRSSAIVVFGLTTALIFSAAAPASAGRSTDEGRFVSKINGERRARGISSLRVAYDLVSVARRHSASMAARGRIFHSSRLGSKISGNWTEVGENVGAGPDVPSLHSAFMQSPSHRANVLRRSYNQVGVGVVYGSDDMIYVTVIFAARGATQRAVVKKAARARSSAPARSAPRVRAVPPKRAPTPPPPPRPRTVDVLVRLVQMDADLFADEAPPRP